MKTTLNEIRDELIENFENRTLYEYICKYVLEIRKEDSGEIQSLVFGIGGPSIFLDINGGYSGCVCGYLGGKEKFSAIPWLLWEKMEEEIIDLVGGTI